MKSALFHRYKGLRMRLSQHGWCKRDEAFRKEVYERTSKYTLGTNSHLMQKLVNLMIVSVPSISALQATVSHTSLYHRFGRPRGAAARALSADTSHGSRGNLQERFSCSWNKWRHPLLPHVKWQRHLHTECIQSVNTYNSDNIT